VKLGTKLTIFSVTVVAGSVGLFGWGVDRFVRQQSEQEQRQKSGTLITQFRREFAHRGDEVVYAIDGIAQAEGTLRIAIDLSRAQSDPSLYARDAMGIASSRQIDFLEIVGDDGTLISSAQWPGRIGFKNDWVTQRADWNEQGAFLARVELPDKVELGLLCVRTVNVGEKKLYLVGGRKLDSDFLQALVIPAGMQVMLYRNLEAAFVPEALLDSEGAASQPERFTSLIGSIQKQARAGDYEVPGSGGTEKFVALPLTGRNNETLAVILVGNAQDAAVKTSAYIRSAGLVIGAAGILLALIFSASLAATVSRPLQRLEKAARELAAGDWKAKANVTTRGEAGRAVCAFNEMTAQLSARREGLLQAERVAAWRELARNFAVELKVPLFSLQLTLENLARAREKTPEKFDGIFVETMRMAHAEVENLKEIVAHFSDFAKMRQPRMQAVNVNEVVRATLKSFEPAFHARGRPPIKPELVLDEDTEKIWADPELLYKGFENVIANSLNAMPMGGTLTVHTAQQNGMVRVEISDTGSGLDAEPTEVAVRYAAKLEGAGLGLATIQTVVSDHGGRMSVEAIPGAGTAFRMEFPVAPTSVKAPEVATDLKASKSQTDVLPKKSLDAAPLKSPEATKTRKPVLARMMDI
jgi:two-component system, NtrC family, nitrogen regulation sensor histidine kinase NtrY